MKKRAMKKWIPRDTDYCYGRIKFNKKGIPYRSNYCRNLIFDHVCKDSIVVPKEAGSIETMEIPCTRKIYRCRYTGRTTLEDACLYDDCKCCGIGYPDDEYYK
jgi:hypothetical protein